MNPLRRGIVAIAIVLYGCITGPTLPQRALVEPEQVSAAIQLATMLDKREGVAIPQGESWVKTINGDVPVIITAPHVTRPLREGKRRFSDGGGTGALAVALGGMTGATVIYTTYEGPSDPNYYDDNKFKEELARLIDEIKPRYILDIHGSHPFRSYDIDLGTMNGRSLLGNDSLLSTLVERLKGEGIWSISYNRFAASKNGTITKFVSEKGVPAIQLEINATYLTPASGNIEAQRFSRLLQALVRFIGPSPILPQQLTKTRQSSSVDPGSARD